MFVETIVIYSEQLNTIHLNDEQVQIPYLNWLSLRWYFYCLCQVKALSKIISDNL